MFWFLYGIIRLLSLLPFKVIYLISDCLFPFVYYLARYRRKVVRKNLVSAFPEKDMAGIVKIEKRFYRFFIDMMLETIKEISANTESMKQRMTFGNMDLIYRHQKEGRSVMLMMAHYCNWEWNTVFCLDSPENYKGYPIYQRLTDSRFDKLMLRLRSRFGAITIEKDDLFREMVKMRQEGIHGIFGMISDQSPMAKYIRYRMPFLNQDTPVFLGTEQLARRFDYPVYYLNVKRIKRGFYHAEIEPVCLNPSQTSDYEITTLFMQRLEKSIHEQPEYWLWTHNRWKHARKDA